MNESIIIVAGATGNLGGRITRALVARGASVRALIRHGTAREKVERLQELGVTIASVDFSSASQVTAAVEAWSKMDTAALNQEWNKYVKRIATMVESVRGVTTEITVPTEENSCPTLTVKWDRTISLTVEECVKQLRGGDPRIEVLSGNNPSLVPAVHEGDVGPEPEKRSAAPRRPGATEIRLLSMNLQPGEDLLIGRRLCEILGAARKPA